MFLNQHPCTNLHCVMSSIGNDYRFRGNICGMNADKTDVDSLSHVDINSSMVHNNGGGTRVQRVGGQPPPKKMIQIQICERRSLSACSLPLPDRLSRSLGFRSGGKSIAGPITAFLCFLLSLSFCLKQESLFSAKFSRKDVQ